MKHERPSPVVQIWTDGACKGNPGKGGWAAVFTFNQHCRIMGGFCKHSTNNQMELQAVVEALKALRVSSVVSIFTDSMYVVYGAHSVLKGKPAKSHPELWRLVHSLSKMHSIHFFKTTAHGCDPYNNMADRVASDCAIRQVVVDNRYDDVYKSPVFL